jgi:hypothetical protein
LLHADSAESGDEGEEGGVSENPANWMANSKGCVYSVF